MGVQLYGGRVIHESKWDICVNFASDMLGVDGRDEYSSSTNRGETLSGQVDRLFARSPRFDSTRLRISAWIFLSELLAWPSSIVV